MSVGEGLTAENCGAWDKDLLIWSNFGRNSIFSIVWVARGKGNGCKAEQQDHTGDGHAN